MTPTRHVRATSTRKGMPMMKTILRRQLKRLGLASAAGLLLASCGQEAAKPAMSYQEISDALHAVMASDRTVYTQVIVNRLQNVEKVIKASEHWKDDKALALPAQMFRYGAEMVAKKTDKFSYQLLSLWPVNKQNKPRTEAESAGLKFVAENKGKNYYTTETLGGKKYFTAVYADIAVAQACVSCHNEHKDSPRTDFKMGDVMGGVVVRLPM